IHVGVPNGLETIPEIAAQALDLLGEKISMGVDPHADLREVISELALRLLKEVGVHPPGTAEDVWLSAEHVRALGPPRGIASDTHVLTEAQARARAEKIVVADLGKTPRAISVAVAEPEIEMPRFSLAERDLDVVERIGLGTQRLDGDRGERGKVTEPTLP